MNFSQKMAFLSKKELEGLFLTKLSCELSTETNEWHFDN